MMECHDFVALRSKMYASKVYKVNQINDDKKGITNEKYCHLSNFAISKKVKGVKKCVAQHDITFDDYVECLEKWKEKYVKQNLIQFKRHEIHSATQKKVALSRYDDKRILTPGSVEKLPWGHYSLKMS
ncbi:unnamed protein product [Callosobruchus maculatus]|uniref:Uncharacterized protein n=1 Tax=Callosobruchus maculatus TaxID=64391 RepID=A0A653BST8_CALMS|nr:unnamed protein product [Callosobruchus maculatus]